MANTHLMGKHRRSETSRLPDNRPPNINHLRVLKHLDGYPYLCVGEIAEAIGLSRTGTSIRDAVRDLCEAGYIERSLHKVEPASGGPKQWSYKVTPGGYNRYLRDEI